MRLINGNKFIAALLLLTFCFCNSTCKKIWKYPDVSMYGVWVCDHDECGYMKLEIKKNGRGNYGPNEACDKHNAKGKVRFTDAALFVGDAKLNFVHKPEYVVGNDSVMSFGLTGKSFGAYDKVIAKLTLKESTLRGGMTYILYKIKNY